MHTSASSVAVMPQATQVELNVPESDLRVETYRSGGAGGQHVNTTDSAVRVTHVPTGISVAIQDDRSQHKNRAKALKILLARLREEETRRRDAALAEKRRVSETFFALPFRPRPTLTASLCPAFRPYRLMYKPSPKLAAGTGRSASGRTTSSRAG